MTRKAQVPETTPTPPASPPEETAPEPRLTGGSFVRGSPGGTPAGTDPDALNAIQSELADREALPDLEAAIQAQGDLIEKRLNTESRAAAERVAEVRETNDLRLLGQTVRACWEDYEAAVREIRSTYQRDVQPAHLQEARARLDERLGKLQGQVENTAGVVRRLGKAVVPPPPSQALASEAELVLSRFPLTTGREFLTETLGVLERAQDTDLSLTERGRATQLLRLAYGPLVQRRAESPERHARGLQPAYRNLAELVSQHLDLEAAGPLRRATSHVSSQAVQDFQYVLGAAEAHGGWSDTHELGSPFFYWGWGGEKKEEG